MRTALFRICPAGQLDCTESGRSTIVTCPGVKATVREKLGVLTGYWTVTDVGTSLVSWTDAVTAPSGFHRKPAKNSRPLLEMTWVEALHWLVSRLQSFAQRRMPPPRPNDRQVCPRRSERSQSSEGWFTTPSPHAGAALQPLTLKLLQSVAQARLPLAKPCVLQVWAARSVPSQISKGWL